MSEPPAFRSSTNSLLSLPTYWVRGNERRDESPERPIARAVNAEIFREILPTQKYPIEFRRKAVLAHAQVGAPVTRELCRRDHGRT